MEWPVASHVRSGVSTVIGARIIWAKFTREAKMSDGDPNSAARGIGTPPLNDPFRRTSGPEASLNSADSFANLGRTRRLGEDGVTYPIGFIHMSFQPRSGDMAAACWSRTIPGVPLEFRITTAVRPTVAQRILYGNRLKSYVAINLCATQLVQSVEQKPRVIFVREDWMLGLANIIEIPALMLRRSESLGTVEAKPTIVPPHNRPHYVGRCRP